MSKPDIGSNDTDLLPEGLHDTLGYEAEYQAEILEKLRQCFAHYGYERIDPPLLEFEESLSSGLGKAQSLNMFRVMDPSSMRMMAVRNDMTGQVARIARTRLSHTPRPLRLSYSGSVLRACGTQLRPEREFKQAGVELIGSDHVEAYVEIILLARDVLDTLGIKKASIDLTMPLLVPAICKGLNLDEVTSTAIRVALNAKNIGDLENLTGEIGEISRKLLFAAGSADHAMDILNRLNLPLEAEEICQELATLLVRLRAIAPELSITIDPGEYSGFKFQTGIGFSLFVKGARGEVGRGGRYMIEGDGKNESATGFSLYLDSLMGAMPDMADLKYIYCPFGTVQSDLDGIRQEGYRTICGLEAIKDELAEAKRLKCGYVWQSGNIIKL